MALSCFRPAAGTPPCPTLRTGKSCLNPLTTTITIRGQALIGEVLRAITKLPDIRDRSVVRSSVIPSAKYSCSRSSLRFVKGSTTIDRRGAAAGWEINRIIFVNDSSILKGSVSPLVPPAALGLSALARKTCRSRARARAMIGGKLTSKNGGHRRARQDRARSGAPISPNATERQGPQQSSPSPGDPGEESVQTQFSEARPHYDGLHIGSDGKGHHRLAVCAPELRSSLRRHRCDGLAYAPAWLVARVRRRREGASRGE